MAREPRGRAKQLAEEIEQDEDASINPADVPEPDLAGFPEDGQGFDEPPPAAEPTPEFEEVTVGGQTFTVLKGQAEALQSSYEELVSREPDRIYQEPAPTPQEPDPNFEDQFFEDPGRFLQDFRQQIKNEVREELTTEYQVNDARQQFWRDFYTENPDLSGEQAIVQAVMTENWSSLENTKGKDSRDKLANFTKQKILALSGKVGGGKRAASETESLEGGRTVTRTRQEPREDPVPQSLSAGIKARRAARAQHRNILND